MFPPKAAFAHLFTNTARGARAAETREKAANTTAIVSTPASSKVEFVGQRSKVNLAKLLTQQSDKRRSIHR